METRSLGDANYFTTFVDDYSKKIFVNFLHKKSEALEKFKEFKNQVEKQLECHIKCLRSDNGLEYVNSSFSEFLKNNGIIHQSTTPYTPEQNGVSELHDRTLVEKAKWLLINANLPKMYWAESIHTATYLINRSPTRSLKYETPEEIWTRKKPNTHHLKVFGCEAMIHLTKEKRRKWDPKAQKATFIRYCDHTKGYRFLLPGSRTVIKSNDAMFFESTVKKNYVPVDLTIDSSIEAIASPDLEKWLTSIRKELEAHPQNGTWTLIEKPPNAKLIGSKWIFRIKDETTGPRFKARLCAKGYSQQEGIDYNETFSPTVSIPADPHIKLQKADDKPKIIHIEGSWIFDTCSYWNGDQFCRSEDTADKQIDRRTDKYFKRYTSENVRDVQKILILSKRFRRYCVYAFGLPLLLSVLVAVLEFLPIEEHYLLPRVRKQECLLRDYSNIKRTRIVSENNTILLISNALIPRQHNYKYLGITSDKHLHFRDHIQRVRQLAKFYMSRLSEVPIRVETSHDSLRRWDLRGPPVEGSRADGITMSIGRVR
ncbi:Retrovirus-related Pol polyprotein from transposon TNT 1-94 [Eumeta japonica]|uniref:Retrovirus-related Pol polyprotein from transposon TNT 1-94 n=1 Tax=Eumeta variegata TaxID=151549 RepID=A0A4C1WQZ7_EUMVA|nr:Retrovirus-related Pol polyprotein from transposon TNT 1-94 [Eumeta japonica]